MQKAEEPSGAILFEEKRRFPPWLSVVMLSPIAIIIGVGLLLRNAQKNEQQEMWIVLAIIIPVQLLLTWLFYSTSLEKVVTTNGLYFRWPPLQKRFRVIEKEEMEKVQVRMRPRLKYGSKYVLGYGWMHTVSKGEGAEVLLRSGKKIFFGTAGAGAFLKALQELAPPDRKPMLREF
jgi:hypothetical protein